MCAMTCAAMSLSTWVVIRSPYSHSGRTSSGTIMPIMHIQAFPASAKASTAKE